MEFTGFPETTVLSYLSLFITVKSLQESPINPIK